MRGLRGCLAAFAMYSAIPVPRVAWDEDSLRHVLGFFPLIGVVIGGALWLWGRAAAALSLGPALFAAVALALPILLSGGIHLDGFCDTADALASRRGTARKLEILKDPRVGAFAVMACGLYLLLYFSLLWEGGPALPAGPLAGGFVLSRALAALGAVCLPQARRNGTLRAFASLADGPGVLLAALVFIAGAAALMLWLDPPAGGACLAAALLSFLWYRRVSLRHFGGITGDLSGCFLCVCELSMTAAAVLVLLARRGLAR